MNDIGRFKVLSREMEPKCKTQVPSLVSEWIGFYDVDRIKSRSESRTRVQEVSHIAGAWVDEFACRRVLSPKSERIRLSKGPERPWISIALCHIRRDETEVQKVSHLIEAWVDGLACRWVPSLECERIGLSKGSEGP